jgi:hypothetical protein
MRNKVPCFLAASAATGCLIVSCLRVLSTYREYYGEGPPYYGLTTNMDKWQTPVADLVTSSGLGLLSLSALVYAIRCVVRCR